MGVGILVEDLNAWYGTTHTLQDINLHIPANHATALIGPSGCGKSTFVRCLNRMHETNPIARATGVVKMGEVDIYKDASPVEIRRRVGMVFQRPNPFPTMSIYDNVISGLKLNGFRNRRDPRRDRRAFAQAGCAMGRGEGRSEEEVRSFALRRTAAAHVHRSRSCRRPRGPSDGRACLCA